MTKNKLESLLILESNDSLRKGLTVGLLDVFFEITSASYPEEIFSAKRLRDFSFIITGTDFENSDPLEIIKKLRVDFPLAKLFIITDKTDDAAIKKLNKLNPQKIYSNLFDLKELINDIKQVYEN